MTAINVTNKDWAIVGAVKSALAGATINGEAVFESVSVTTSSRQGDQCQFTRNPAAIVRYLTTREHVSPQGEVGCVVSLELVLAVKVDSPASDESLRIQEILRLVNAAKNAIQTSLPSDACAWTDGKTIIPSVEFLPCELDTAHRQPWSVAQLPITLTFALNNATSH